MSDDYVLCAKCQNRLCPKCGKGHVQSGYGLMGGGCGMYEYCDADGCDYFTKEQDVEE